jgi:hypothetical protein
MRQQIKYNIRQVRLKQINNHAIFTESFFGKELIKRNLLETETYNIENNSTLS